MEKKLQEIIKQLLVEVEQIEAQGYKVEIDLKLGKYRTADKEKPTISISKVFEV